MIPPWLSTSRSSKTLLPCSLGMQYLGLYMRIYTAYTWNKLKQQTRFLHMQPWALLAHLDVGVLEQSGFPCLGRDCILDGWRFRLSIAQVFEPLRAGLRHHPHVRGGFHGVSLQADFPRPRQPLPSHPHCHMGMSVNINETPRRLSQCSTHRSWSRCHFRS